MTTGILTILGLGMPAIAEWVILGIFFIIPLIIVIVVVNRKKVDKEKLINTYKFASFGQRLLARFIDVLITSAIGILLAIIIGSSSPNSIEAASTLSMFIFCFIYQPILEATGGTWGKKIVDLRTINLNTGKAPTFMDSFGRSFLYFLFVIYLVIPALLSGLAVLWTTCKQTWHDTAFNIAVITNSPTKEIKTPEGFKQNSILKHADKLRELKQLQEQGIISNEEFESEKRKILDSDN